MSDAVPTTPQPLRCVHMSMWLWLCVYARSSDSAVFVPEISAGYFNRIHADSATEYEPPYEIHLVADVRL